MKEKFLIQDIFTISDLETLKVISDPLRIQILDSIRLANEDNALRTVKQLSGELKLPVSKLYYHINLLERYGLIHVGDTQIVSGILEKHYHVAARNLQVDHTLFAAGLDDEKNQAAIALYESTMAATRIDFIKLLESVGTPQEPTVRLQNRRAHITRDQVRMTQAQANEFYDQLLGVLDAFNNISPDSDEEVCVFSLTTAFIPTVG